MIEGLSVLALIPARGGSKGLPRKNVLQAGGRPLLAWSIEAARQSRYVDKCVVSSDDDEVMEAGRLWGAEVPFRRPAELASDTASSIDVVVHALDMLGAWDIVVLLQPTSPLRMAQDIDATLEQMLLSNAPSCVSVCPVEESPYWMFTLDARHELHPVLGTGTTVTRRQDLPPVYRLNGAVYAARTSWLRQTRSFVASGTVAHPMPLERSLDIDTQADFDAFTQSI